MSTDVQQQPQTVVENLLLARLMVHERNAVHREAVIMSCAPGQVLFTPNAPLDFVFFPIDTVVAIVRSLRDGSTTELGLVGNEGMIGLDAFIDAKAHSDGAIVQSGGSAYCLPSDALRRQLHRGGGLQKSLLRFMNAFLSQLSQNAVCGRYHPLDARLARWLLMLRDRRTGREVDATAESMASALGASQSDIEEAISILSTGRAVRTRRGTVSITNAQALEMAACECYDTLRQVYDRTLAA
jgi:CRP-like cAMP-binding protein